LVNRQLLEHEHARKWKEEIGYIIDVETTKRWNDKTKKNIVWAFDRLSISSLVVRPQLHCPEIDSYDEITVKQIIWTFEKKSELEIGDKIMYTV
jgi:hypothetical protein